MKLNISYRVNMVFTQQRKRENQHVM